MYRTAVGIVVAVSLVVSSALVFAQRGQGQGQGPGASYNPATEVTLTGTVDEVKSVQSPGRGLGGLHLMVRAETGLMEVVLGPAAFVSSKNFTFTKGDAVTVTGSKITTNGHDVIVAREVSKADKVLTLRDAKGFPLWSGRMRGKF